MPAVNPANLSSPVAYVPVDGSSGSVMGAANYTGISTNGTTVIKSSAGVFYGLYILTAGASSNTLVVYDGTASSTNVLYGTATNQAVGTAGGAPGGIPIRFVTGLTVVMATGTAAVGNVLWD